MIEKVNKHSSYIEQYRRLFESYTFNELVSISGKGEPGSNKIIKVLTTKRILGGIEFVVGDDLGNVWYIPQLRNRNGDIVSDHISFPLELHFDENGRVEYAIHLRPVIDPEHMTDAERALGQALGLL